MATSILVSATSRVSLTLSQCRRLLTPRQADAELNHGDGGADDDDDERGGWDGDGQDVVVNEVNHGPGREYNKSRKRD